MDVLRSTGVQSEAEIPFAALHQLVRPCLALIDNLPRPQAAALRGAFGITFERADDAFLSSLALLSLLAEAATKRPLLCLIDDAQWLDRSSADALLFAARRLHAEPIAMLIAAREGDQAHFEAPGFPELTLNGLSDNEARELVALRMAGAVGGAEVDSLIRTALGNPLALLELPILHGHGRGRAVGRAVPAASAGSIQDVFRARVERLPDQTRRVLLLAAADEVSDVACLRRAAAYMGSDLDTRAGGARRSDSYQRGRRLPPSVDSIGRLPISELLRRVVQHTRRLLPSSKKILGGEHGIAPRLPRGKTMALL